MVRCALHGGGPAAVGSFRAAAAAPQATAVTGGSGNGQAAGDQSAAGSPGRGKDSFRNENPDVAVPRRHDAAAGAAGPDDATAAPREPAAAGSAGAEAEREVVPLLEPRDGLPPLIATAAALDDAIGQLRAGSGAVAVDAERASGFRYGHRAVLVQLRRDGAGTVLVDPVACPDLSGLDAALADAEIVFHAASQDLPCLAEVGF